MKIHRVWWSHSDGCSLAWFNNQYDARRFVRTEIEDEFRKDAEIDVVDVPTTKKELVVWLNDNLSDANG